MTLGTERLYLVNEPAGVPQIGRQEQCRWVNEVAFGYGINGASRCTRWGKSYHSPSIRGSSFPIEILDYNLVLEMLISTSGRLQTHVVLLR